MSETSESLRGRVDVLDMGRITIPKAIREKLGIKKDSILEVYLLKNKIVMEVLAL